jgi:hypothetical protein
MSLHAERLLAKAGVANGKASEFAAANFLGEGAPGGVGAEGVTPKTLRRDPCSARGAAPPRGLSSSFGALARLIVAFGLIFREGRCGEGTTPLGGWQKTARFWPAAVREGRPPK